MDKCESWGKQAVLCVHVREMILTLPLTVWYCLVYSQCIVTNYEYLFCAYDSLLYLHHLLMSVIKKLKTYIFLSHLNIHLYFCKKINLVED
jgi:hypothetical protein